MTRAELYNGKWHIVKHHAITKKLVAISEKSYASRRMAVAMYDRGRIGYLENSMQFVRVK